jgi:hypothetical protein
MRPDVLAEPVWRVRAAAHESRVEPWVRPHLERRRLGRTHPVEDFCFTYYSYSPSRLRRWHPGAGTVLAGATARRYLAYAGYRAEGDGVTADLDRLADRLPTLRFVRGLLAATADRPAHFGCFGLHEWAMVYRQRAEENRHTAYPLRLGRAGTDEVVESHPLRCTHFDAFRFFTSPARPRNATRLTRDDQIAAEQPGCLHATMDLYRWAYKLAPFTPSELVADCFALAREIRAVDMRASPYDLQSLGYQPIRIETASGRAEYVRAQRDFADRAAPLRQRLAAECDRLLALLDAGPVSGAGPGTSAPPRAGTRR